LLAASAHQLPACEPTWTAAAAHEVQQLAVPHWWQCQCPHSLRLAAALGSCCRRRWVPQAPLAVVALELLLPVQASALPHLVLVQLPGAAAVP